MERGGIGTKGGYLMPAWQTPLNEKPCFYVYKLSYYLQKQHLEQIFYVSESLTGASRGYQRGSTSEVASNGLWLADAPAGSGLRAKLGCSVTER